MRTNQESAGHAGETQVDSSLYQLLDYQWPQAGSGESRVITYAFTEGGFVQGDSDRDFYLGGGTLTGTQEQLVRQAMDAWEAVCGVRFVEAAETPEVNVRIGFQWQIDSDGPGGTLGVTWTQYFPGVIDEQTVVFDPNEAWDNELFYDTALHELGHVLGIDHSNVEEVVMSGTSGGTAYHDQPGRDQLQPDDIAGAVAIWGPAAGTPPTPPTPPPPPPPPEPPVVPEPTPGHNPVFGTPAGERLVGTEGNDVMSGGAGYDVVVGKGGDDILIGGPDGSTLFGQAGADTFVFSGGQNWFMDFDASEGDQIAGVNRDYLDANANQYRAGDHLAVYFGENPWDATGPGTIWLANTSALPEGDAWLA